MRPAADGYRVTVGRTKKPITDRTNLKDVAYEDQDIAAVNGVIPIPGDVAFMKAPENMFNILIKLNSVNSLVPLNAYLRWHYRVYLGTVRCSSRQDRGMHGLYDTLVRRGIDIVPIAARDPYRISGTFEEYANARPMFQAVFNKVNRNRLFVQFMREHKLNAHEMTDTHASVEAIANVGKALGKVNQAIAAKTDMLQLQLHPAAAINWDDEIRALEPLIAHREALKCKLERLKKERSMTCISNSHVANLTVEGVARAWVYDGLVTRASPNVNGTGKKHPEDYLSIAMNILQQGRAPTYILSSDVSSSFYAEAVQVDNGPVSVAFRGPARSIPDRAYRDALYADLSERDANRIRKEVRTRLQEKHEAPKVPRSRPHDKPIYVRGPSYGVFAQVRHDLGRGGDNAINWDRLLSPVGSVEEMQHGVVRSVDCVVNQRVTHPRSPTKRRSTPFGKYAGGLFCGEPHAEGSQTELTLTIPEAGLPDDDPRPLEFIDKLDKEMKSTRFPYWRLQPDIGYSDFCKEWFKTLSFGTTRPLEDFLNWDKVQTYAHIPIRENAFSLLNEYVRSKTGVGDAMAPGYAMPVPVFEQKDLPTSEEWTMFPLIKKVVEKYKKKLEKKRTPMVAELLRTLGDKDLPIDQLLFQRIDRNLPSLATMNEPNTRENNRRHVRTEKIASLRHYLGFLQELVNLLQVRGDDLELIGAEFVEYREELDALNAEGDGVEVGPAAPNAGRVAAYQGLLDTWLVGDTDSEHYDELIPVQIYRQVREMVRNSVRTAPLNRGHPVCTILSTPRTLARREVRHLEIQGVRRHKTRLASGINEKNWMDTELAAKRAHISTIPQMAYTRSRYTRPTSLLD